MNFLLDVEEEDQEQESVSGYKAFPGPFTQLPSSILEDIIHGINDSRGLPKQMLHQTILPQLEVIETCDFDMQCNKCICAFRVTKSEAEHRDTFRRGFLVRIVNC